MSALVKGGKWDGNLAAPLISPPVKGGKSARTFDFTAAVASASAASASASASAAFASAAASAAVTESARDRVLSQYAEWVVEILIDMHAPGCEFLDFVPVEAMA